MISSSCHDPNEYDDYLIGQTSPPKEKFLDRLYLVGYDIKDAKRLHKVARICGDYGIRVEFSFFECDLCEQDFNEFWKKLKNVIAEQEDKIISYRICASCASQILTLGPVKRFVKPSVWII